MAAAQKLPSKYVKLAKARLGEDPKNIPAHVEALRRWLSSMPHLTCPDGDITLTFVLKFEAMPMRPRHVIIYNEGKLLDTMLSIMMFYMKEKMKNRIVRCGSDIEKVFEAEPDLRAVLPPEVGSEGKPLEDLIQANKKRFHEFYGKGDPTGKIRVDESKRPVSARDFLHDYKDYNANVMGKSGTYVKVDQSEI
ncbi:lipid-binding protein [Echinococcus granulosus]|uniref:Lipid-binding protein n=1 Tax=Echinococcus granulosus TaxID=6210 RepID=W6ULV2_ECHGR|nr:lipid-binding protein [Echinococcus granulosus]EUB59142.1 lipid-binding protein [Echinococcus granulosus]